MKKIFLISMLIPTISVASTKRIQSVLFDKGLPHKIYLHPGLGSVVIFPCFVSESFLGDDSQVDVRPSPSTRKNLLLNLKSNASKPTNLIVRCEGQLTHFVLDIIPSSTTHQDILEIRAAFGRPEIKESEAIFPESQNSIAIPKKVVVTAPVLIETSSQEAK